MLWSSEKAVIRAAHKAECSRSKSAKCWIEFPLDHRICLCMDITLMIVWISPSVVCFHEER
ncbi:hypothetical protein ACOSP7_001812 [Xanthoceras sorbifolium]